MKEKLRLISEIKDCCRLCNSVHDDIIEHFAKEHRQIIKLSLDDFIKTTQVFKEEED